MSRKKESPPAGAPSSPSLRVGGANAALVVGLAAAETLLALYQWMELVLLRAGGQTVCGINETVNCDVVWNSDFASRVHGLLGVPVAALGLAWGLAALALSLWLVISALDGKSVTLPVLALRITGVLGALSCVTFAVASFRSGALCPTCLGTYVLVGLFAFATFRVLPGSFTTGDPLFTRGVLFTLGAQLAGFLVVLGPGLATAKKEDGKDAMAQIKARRQQPQPDPGTTPEPVGTDDLSRFIGSLKPSDKQVMAQALAVYRSGKAVDGSRFPVRQLHGSKDAPVKVVEWTDIRCGHCAMLAATLKGLKEVLPADQFSVEPRHFPLDKECNPFMQQTDGKGVRCAGARAQICLEGKPDYWELQQELFEKQEELTVELIKTIASSGSLSRVELDACMASPDTETKLRADIAYAMEFNPEGTPIVALNGKPASPFGPFLYAMGMTGGDASAPAFKSLPAPRAPEPGHEGHAH